MADPRFGSRKQIDSAIGKFRRRLEKLNALESDRPAWGSERIKNEERALKRAVGEVFGENSHEYEEHVTQCIIGLGDALKNYSLADARAPGYEAQKRAQQLRDGFQRTRDRILGYVEQLKELRADLEPADTIMAPTRAIGDEYQFTLRNVEEQAPRDYAAVRVLFHFDVVPKTSVGTPQEAQQTQRRVIDLWVPSLSLLHCAPWRDLAVDDRNRHFFAYVQEKLHTEIGLPEEGLHRLNLDEYTDDGRFERGPLYSLEHVHPDKPFAVSCKRAIVDAPAAPGSFEYDVAISFAGPDRETAEQIAHALRERGIRVFYDDFERDSLWGKNLYEHLSEVYKSKSRFCMMLLSEAYADRQWTNHERQSAQARAFEEKREYILPVRLDSTEIPGLLGTVGFVSLPETSIPELVELLVRKLKADQ